MILILIAAAGAAVQASPQFQAGVACIVPRISSERRADIVREVGAGGEGGAGESAVEQAALACASERGWSDADSGRFGSAAVASIIEADATARLAAGGLDAKLIRSWYFAQPKDTRVDISQSDTTGEQLAEALMTQGVSPEVVEANAEGIGLLISALAVTERLERQLPLE
ncbi:MAG TPA: hypothetical protein VEZ41_05960 [Allosphingosinicella sp.]|nr:hypothetical protein [Allosphingosinicella sp.]